MINGAVGSSAAMAKSFAHAGDLFARRKARLGGRPPRHGGLGDRAAAGAEGCEVMTAGREVDLKPRIRSQAWMAEKPDAVFLAAAKVGGILANDSYPADFLYDNLMIEANIIEAAHRTGVEKLLFLGSSPASIRSSPSSRSSRRRC
jgi:hypothetical protein